MTKFSIKEKIQKDGREVLGSEGKVVLVRHGSFYQRCHPCHLMKVFSESGVMVQAGDDDSSAFTADEDVDIDKTNTKTNNKKTSNNKTNNRNATKRNAELDDVDTSSEEETLITKWVQKPQVVSLLRQ